MADLQTRLCSLGFDTGRVDGIYGDNTATAVAEFQRNLKLAVDGIAGRNTLEELTRITTQKENPWLVTTVREQANRYQSSVSLEGFCIGIISTNTLSAVSSAMATYLGDAGAIVIPVAGHAESEQASEANQSNIDLLLALHSSEQTRVAHYRSYSYESVAGRELSALVATAISTVDGIHAVAEGMYLSLLRETSMVAIVVELVALDLGLELAEAIASAITSAMIAWAAGSSRS